MGYRGFVVMCGLAILVGTTGCAGAAAENAAPDSATSSSSLETPGATPTLTQTASATPTATPTATATATAQAAIGPDGVPARLLDGDCTRLFTEDELEALVGKQLKAQLASKTYDRASVETQHGISCGWGDVNETAGLVVDILPRLLDGVDDVQSCPATNRPESSCLVIKAVNGFSVSVVLVGGTAFDAKAKVEAVVGHIADAIAGEQPIHAPLPATTLQWDKADCRAIRDALEREYNVSLEADWFVYTDTSGEGTYFDDAVLAGSGSGTCSIAEATGPEAVQVSIDPGEAWTVDPDVLNGSVLHVPNADAALRQTAQPKDVLLALGRDRVGVDVTELFDEERVAAIVAGVLASS